MEKTTQTLSTNLPENAYRELKSGEVYRPVMSHEYTFPEVTPYSLIMGLLMAVIFSAAAAYSGLKIGQVMEAAIPISILAVGISAAIKKRGALGQNVIIQSIGASSGVIVAGAIFTLPALYILQLDVNFFQIFFSSLFGGFLGILFLIPFRKYFVKDMHGKFPFPEAKATTEILITGEKGGKQAGILIISGLIGGIYDFLFNSLHLWRDVFTSRVLPIGEYIAEKSKILFQLNISSIIFGFGYLIGLKYSTIITVGSLLSWFILVPLINQIGAITTGTAGINIFASLSPEEIFKAYVRPIGIGAIAMAGIIGIIKSSKVIGGAFGLAFAGLFGSKKAKIEDEIRTQKDLKMTFVVLMILLSLIAVFVFLITGVNVTFVQALVALLTILIIAFLFTTVAANAIAIVGSNPVSGMTLMTLILSSFVLVQFGLTGQQGMLSALIIGGIVCTALSMAGGFITDLKVGYWLGSTPKKQESFKFLGTFVSAATIGIVIYVLSQAYGFVKTPETPNPLEAPQANAMAAVIQPLMTPGANVNWMLYLVGAIIAILINWLGISPLAFALGMYLPLDLNTPLVIGALIAHIVSKSSTNEKLVEARSQRGTLIASGFMAGASLFGVVGAVLLFFNVIDKKFNEAWLNNPMTEVIAILMFLVIVTYFIIDTFRAKVED